MLLVGSSFGFEVGIIFIFFWRFFFSPVIKKLISQTKYNDCISVIWVRITYISLILKISPNILPLLGDILHPQIKPCLLLEQRKYGKFLHHSQNQSSCGCSCEPWANSLNQMLSDFLKGRNILGFAGCAVSALHLWLESSHKQ